MRQAVTVADLLADFEDLIPQLRDALRAGKSAEEIYATFQPLVAARTVQIALTETDSAKAISAIRDVLDRTQGKPKEKIETTHRLEKLPEEQLDAALRTKLQDVNRMMDKTKH